MKDSTFEKVYNIYNRTPAPYPISSTEVTRFTYDKKGRLVYAVAIDKGGDFNFKGELFIEYEEKAVDKRRH